MTREEVQTNLNTRDLEWLESRWSVLHEAIKAIEPHLAEVEAAFDHDYTVNSKDDDLEKYVCDQCLELWAQVTSTDTEGTVSWTEIMDMLNDEIERREKLPVPPVKGRLKFKSDYTVRKMDTGKVESLVVKHDNG